VGNEEAAKAVVLKLVDELGFDGVDAGGLNESWRQQPQTLMRKVCGVRTSEWRGTADNPG
jgi:8-hydroxy-5-deazaflavin:NADPH oxidoreductase